MATHMTVQTTNINVYFEYCIYYRCKADNQKVQSNNDFKVFHYTCICKHVLHENLIGGSRVIWVFHLVIAASYKKMLLNVRMWNLIR